MIVTEAIRAAVQPRWNPYMPTTMNPKQAIFLGPVVTELKEAFYGGAAGGGKSVALLGGALQFVDMPDYAALLLRKTYKDLAQPGALMDLASEWLDPTDAHWDGSEKTWRFPSGATLSFGYMESDRDRFRYKGAEFQYIGFDELTQFNAIAYTFLFSRLRKRTGNPVPLRMRAASNPGDIGHEWVRDRFLIQQVPGRIFVPAKLSDNIYVDQESYLESLAELDPVTRRQMLNGDWSARQAGGWFDRTKATIIRSDAVPRNVRAVRYWDTAATEETPGGDPDWTCGLKLGRDGDGYYYVLDVERFRHAPFKRDKAMRMIASEDGPNMGVFVEEEGGASGKSASDYFRRVVFDGFNLRTPRATGSKAQRAQPVSARWDAGDFRVVEAPWNAAFFDELEAFDGGDQHSHDDQVDALSGAFAQLGRRRDAGRIAEINTELRGARIEIPSGRGGLAGGLEL